MIRLCLTLMLAFTLHAAADTGPLVGAWTGQATHEREATPLSIRFEACEQGVCGRLSMNEIGYAEIPLGPLREGDDGGWSAGPLTLQRGEDGALSGVLASAGGGVFIDALGHGGEAQVALRRGAAPLTDLREEAVEFSNGAVTLAGTLVRPRRGGPFPAIVAVLGSGPAHRWYSLARAREWAELGYAVLIYDKRGVGGSAGDWRAASLDDLADDAVSAFRFLQTRGDIRADRIGFWGHSQGGWVAPRAMARGADAAFLIVVSGGGATPRQVEDYGYAGALSHMNVSGAERERAEALIARYFAYLAGDIDLAAFRADMDEVRDAPWFRGLGISRVVPSEEARANWRWVATYDPRADIARIAVPTFVALASADRASPLEASTAGWGALQPGIGARIVIYPGADHHQRIAPEAGWAPVGAAYRSDLAQFLEAQRRR